MKRIFALILTVLISLSLMACSSGNGSGSSAGAQESDMAYIKDKGTLMVGITDFAPMDYKESGSEEWIGFDADMAKAFAEYLGVDIEFVEIVWDNKGPELASKSIDVVWNGMTINDEVRGLMGVGDAYCRNGQVVVVSETMASQYQTVESLEGLDIAAENGSAGAIQLDKLSLPYTAVDTQGKALMEVQAGTSDACVIDLLMAGAMIGDGTDYPTLTHTVQLNDEEYGVGFRKESDLIDEFNSFWKQAYDDGSVMTTAEKYGVQDAIIQK